MQSNMKKTFGISCVQLLVIAAICFVQNICCEPIPPVKEVKSASPARSAKPLCEDEKAALRWLDHVTGTLSKEEEKEWWNIGGRQFGLFSTRYNVAFAGYAAAAIGMRGNQKERETAGRIIDNCIKRILRRDAWAYSQASSYWGKKPWAPDPCYRENVMYTGHLLQLLALYETFTGDTKYWTKGFDFVWSKDKIVHYDVQKLIDVTVEQMREAPSGGLTCEPGLIFFPCNNHPHYALKLFAKLGHGDWSQEARRWEKWAVPHFSKPMLGGGMLCLVYHAKTGIFYPRGIPGLDAWSLLWYEPWAGNRKDAIDLWRKAATMLDWTQFSEPNDILEGEENPCTPSQVPASVTAAFLAAAARACDDVKTAKRLEKALDAKYLRRERGFYWLDLDRQWRIGASAKRIIALAEANGSSFRVLARKK